RSKRARGEGILLAAEVACERLPEETPVGLARCGAREERHRGVELHVVGVAEDLLDRTAPEAGHERSALAQPRAEQRLGEIGTRLTETREREVARGGARTQPGQLRKDEPHPVAALRARGELGAPLPVDRVLCRRKASQVVWIFHVQRRLAWRWLALSTILRGRSQEQPARTGIIGLYEKLAMRSRAVPANRGILPADPAVHAVRSHGRRTRRRRRAHPGAAEAG